MITYMLRTGEIALRGKNIREFEKTLINNIKRSVSHMQARVWYEFNAHRAFIQLEESISNETEIATILSRISGIVNFSRVMETQSNIDSIRRDSCILWSQCIASGQISNLDTFKVETRRTNKSIDMNSYEVSADVGGLLHTTFGNPVDVRNPIHELRIEIRNRTIICAPAIKGRGGMPVGSSGKAVSLLSGGIDSPVAISLMAKRGLHQYAIYFHAHPYTSPEARDKVISLARIISPYNGAMRLAIIPFTDVQLAILKAGFTDYNTILLRSTMMVCAEMYAKTIGASALVTGESLAQVASQTPESLRCTDSVTSLPVFRPLIGMDKQEIIDISRNINTYEKSIEPYEDCCSLFAPKNPVIRPDFAKFSQRFSSLNLHTLIQEALGQAEFIDCWKE